MAIPADARLLSLYGPEHKGAYDVRAGSQTEGSSSNRPGGMLPPASENDLCHLLQMLAVLEQTIDSEPIPSSGWIARPGDFIFRLLEHAGVNMATKTSFLVMLQKALNAVLDRGGSRDISRAAGARLESLLKAFRAVFRGVDDQECYELSKHYRVVIQVSVNYAVSRHYPQLKPLLSCSRGKHPPRGRRAGL